MPAKGGGRPSGYLTVDGERVPSVTSITGRAKDSGGLVFVAKRNWHEAGSRGLQFDRDAYWGTPESWGTDALEAGTIVHKWIEDFLHSESQTDFPEATDEVLWQAGIGYSAFLEWAEQFSPEIVETETPLVSNRFRYGGTLDAVARVGKQTALFDWKTSSGTYQDYIAQVAAYRQLLRERDGDKAPDRAYLLRVGKQHGDFHYHSWPAPVLDLGWRWFLAALDLYSIDKQLAKVSK